MGNRCAALFAAAPAMALAVVLAAVFAVGLILPSAARADSVPSIGDELTVPGWWVVGPFLSGVREAGVDPLAFAEGAPDFENPLLRPSFPSVLVPGGEARWRYYKSDADGKLSVDYPEVSEASMKLVTDEWGGSGANTVGYAYAKLHLDGPRRALLDLRGAGGVSINGFPWPGDPYGNGMGQSPVLLPDGDMELKVAIGGSQSFSLKFTPVGSDLVVFTQSATLPDLVRGDWPPIYIGLPVANTTTEWMTVMSAEINSQGLLGGEVSLMGGRIPPLCVANLTLMLTPSVDNLPDDLAGDEFPVFVILNYEGGDGAGYTEVMLELAIKDAGAPRKVTFFSGMDNSVQYYGLLPPSDFNPRTNYGLILSLHGAGVDALGQVSSYRPKDWAYVAAPTNRRPFGFDWQDWGQRDMLEVLADVKRTCNIDENRVHLTGHSMGGHGTWLNALTFPDLWASAAPSAGWTRFDLYAPMFLRRNLLYGEPRANYIWQLAMRGDDPLALCENARNLPIFALEGGADDNVPPQQPRLLVERLKQLGYDVTYKEVPGMGHWWDDPATPGIDCIDSDELNAFWESHVGNPWPDQIVLRAGDALPVRGAYWIKAKPEQLHQETTIRAQRSKTGVEVTTTNAALLQIKLERGQEHARSYAFTIDGDRLELGNLALGVLTPYVLFEKQAGHWQLSVTKDLSLDVSNEWERTPGYWKSVMQQPCRVVLPTNGSLKEAEWCMQLARLYSYNWWYRGNGALTVVNDKDALVDNEWKGSYICLGVIGSNLLRQDLATLSPMGLNVHGVIVRGHALPWKDVTYKFITPYWLAGERGLCLVEGGTSLAALKRLPAMMGLYSGAGFPDWMVWDDEVKLKGMGGVLGMGFFDMNWQVDPSLSYFNEELIAQRAAGE